MSEKMYSGSGYPDWRPISNCRNAGIGGSGQSDAKKPETVRRPCAIRQAPGDVVIDAEANLLPT